MKDSIKKLAKAKGKNNDDASPLPPDDPDERLVHDAFKNSMTHVHNIVCLFFSNACETNMLI